MTFVISVSISIPIPIPVPSFQCRGLQMAEQDHQEVVDYCGSQKIVNKGSFILQRQQGNVQSPKNF